MQPLVLPSFAKINLGLRVLGRRPDGYHELRTTLQTIDLADEIVLEESPALSLIVEGRFPVPADDSNLVLRAARALADGRPGHGARITLRKTIPPGAGLGGGSSNAAVALLGLDRLWGLDTDPGVLYAMASRLGMDVPFFLYGGRCLAVGRGDEVLPLPDLPETRHLVVVWPGLSLSTREVYEGLPLSLTRPRILSSMKGFLPGPQQRAAGDREGIADPEPRLPEVVNDLEETAFMKVPAMQRLKDRLIGSGASAAAMSGSGSAVFGLFSSAHEADRAAASLAGGETAAFSCRTLARDAYHLNLFKRSRT